MFSTFLQNKLQKTSPFWLNFFIVTTAFMTYFSAYGFRKPFTAAEYDASFALPLFGLMDYKILLIISQIFGYMAAKFWGIKLIAEIKKDNAIITRTLIILLSIAAFSWIFVAIVPPPYNAFFIALNGFPLGLIWGLVFSFVEGRKHTEILGTGLSASYIFAASFSQQIGNWILALGVSEAWMPFWASMVYYLPMLIFAWLLGHTPPPTQEDIALRSERKPMDASERSKFLKTFGFGIILITLAYVLMNAYRELRSNFAKEISLALNFEYELFTLSEPFISIFLLVFLGLFFLIKNNKVAFQVTLWTSIGGALLVGLATVLLSFNLLSGWVWMILVGLGTYVGYIAVSAFTFDRLLAATRWVGTVGFLIYLIDACAYIGSIVIFFTKNYLADFDVVIFVKSIGYTLAIANILLLVLSSWYFNQKMKNLEIKKTE